MYEKSEQLLKQLLKENLPSETKVFLFGSRASNKYSHSSDIDIGFFCEEPVSDGLINKIQELITESFIPYKVDIIDFSKVSETFKKQALKQTIKWNLD